MEKQIAQINPTSAEAYIYEGPGIGGGAESIKHYPPKEGSFVLDIGFGDGECVHGALSRGCTVFGADIAEASWLRACERGIVGKGFIPLFMDVCHDRLPLPSNVIDRAYCLETLEHLANPFFAFAEVKRVLKHKGIFVVAFPQPERNLGYGGGDHAHVYPGFLQRESFERFMMQLYYKLIERNEQGNSAWYLFENIKEGGDIVDVFHVISGNWDEETLYGWMKEV